MNRSSSQGRALSLCAGVVAALPIAFLNPCSALADPPQPGDSAAMGAVLDEAINEVAEGSEIRRQALLRQFALSPKCFPTNLTKEEWAEILRQFPDLLPPTQFWPTDTLRFWTDTIVWTGASGQGSSTQAKPASLTFSFPNDGVTWGLSSVSSTGPNILNSKLTGLFGAANLDLGREYLRQCFASWRRIASITYSEVADNNAAEAQDTAPNPARGDIRIGGLNFGTSQFLAYDAFPSAAGLAGVGGSDMVINTSFFLAANFNDSTNNFRYLRNTVTHEHGHGLSNIHSVPCNNTKLMEPFITTAFDAVQMDEIRGAQRNYGDRFAGNNSAANAKDFGDLTSPSVRSVIQRDLSTNGTAGANNSDEDWFSFTLGSAQNVVITAAPTGSTYTAGQQSSNCTGSTAAINAAQAGNLNIELRDSTGVSVLQTAAAAGAGATETLTANGLAAGTYTARVFDVGPNAAANQNVQLYDLTLRVGVSKAPPLAIAGVHKRIGANTNCFFIGDVNSRVTESGATFSASSYDWDLDGDGSFEVTANAKPNRQYVSNGVYPVTLRVTDSNGMSATDTITVTVFGATTSVATCTPPDGIQGATVPVTITGVNLKNVTNSAMVTVTGAGVSITGTPVPNALGTQVSGLSFVIDAGAATGARGIMISNADGSATGAGLFTVNLGAAPCPADLNGDGSVGGPDLAILLGNWGVFGVGDFDGEGVGTTDLAFLLGSWGACP